MPERVKETGTARSRFTKQCPEYTDINVTSGNITSPIGQTYLDNTSLRVRVKTVSSGNYEEGGWATYGFDFSSVPEDAPAAGRRTTIDSVTTNVRCYLGGTNNNNRGFVYLVTDPVSANNWTVLSDKVQVTSTGTTPYKQPKLNGQISRETLDKLYLVEAQSCESTSTNANRGMYVGGGEIVVAYSVYETYRTLDVSAGENGTCAQAGFKEQIKGVDDDIFTMEFVAKSAAYTLDYILDNGVRNNPTEIKTVAGKKYFVYEISDWSENHTIEAAWKLDVILVDHDITFKIGDVYYDRITTPGYEVLELPEAPEAPEGQAFAGWYYDKNYSRKFTETDYASKTLDSDISVYARFVIVKEPHLITCMYNGVPYGSVTTPGYEEITLPGGPTVELGYEFAGWYTDENFTIKVDNEYYLERPLLKDIILYGKVQETTTGPFKIEITAVDGTILSAPTQAAWDEDITITAQSNDSAYGLRYIELNGNDFDMGTNDEGRVLINYEKINHPDGAIGVFHLNNSDNDSLDNCIASGYNNPAFSTAQKKFGTHAIQFNGSNYLKIDLPDFIVGDDSEDSAFTIDFWVMNTQNMTNGRYPTVFSSYSSDSSTQTNDGPAFRWTYNRTDRVYLNENGTSGTSHIGPNTLSRNVWHHVAFCRNGKQYWWFIDGALTISGTNTLMASKIKRFIFGAAKGATDAVLTNYGFTGFVDEIRISKGVLWTAAFSVPTAEYNAYYDKLYTIQANDVRHNVKGTAYFGPLRNFTVTATASGGTISPASATVTEGNSLEFTFSPNTSGKKIKALLVDGIAVDLSSETTYTLKSIHSDKTVKASYDPILYLKVGDTWKVISKLYIKENGVWVEKPIAGTLSEEEPYAQMPLED